MGFQLLLVVHMYETDAFFHLTATNWDGTFTKRFQPPWWHLWRHDGSCCAMVVPKVPWRGPQHHGGAYKARWCLRHQGGFCAAMVAPVMLWWCLRRYCGASFGIMAPAALLCRLRGHNGRGASGACSAIVQTVESVKNVKSVKIVRSVKTVNSVEYLPNL